MHNSAHKQHLRELHLNAPPPVKPSPRPPGATEAAGGHSQPEKNPNQQIVPVFPPETAATPSRGGGGKAQLGGTPSVPRISSGGRHLPWGGAARPQRGLRRLRGLGGARPAGGGGPVCPCPPGGRGRRVPPPGRSGGVVAGPRRLFPPRPGGAGRGGSAHAPRSLFPPFSSLPGLERRMLAGAAAARMRALPPPLPRARLPSMPRGVFKGAVRDAAAILSMRAAQEGERAGALCSPLWWGG